MTQIVFDRVGPGPASDPIVFDFAGESMSRRSRLALFGAGHTAPVALALRDGGTAIDLSGVTAIRLRMADTVNGTTLVDRDLDMADVISASAGTVYWRPVANDLATAGVYRMDADVTMADGSILPLPNDSFVRVIVLDRNADGSDDMGYHDLPHVVDLGTIDLTSAGDAVHGFTLATGRRAVVTSIVFENLDRARSIDEFGIAANWVDAEDYGVYGQIVGSEVSPYAVGPLDAGSAEIVYPVENCIVASYPDTEVPAMGPICIEVKLHTTEPNGSVRVFATIITSEIPS